MNLVFILVVIYQITQIISESYLFKPFRMMFVTRIPFLYKLLTCFLCTSVWVSFFVHLIFPEFNLNTNWFLNTMFLSGCVWFLHVIEDKLTA